MPTAQPQRLAADPLTVSVCPKTCRDELKRLLKSVHFENAVAVTLTMKKRVGARVADPIVASENFRYFRTRLESRVLGRSARLHSRRLPLIAVLEMSADHRLHYHCVIDRPFHCQFERFSAIIRDQWPKTDFGYHQVDIQDQPDHGWTDYLLKQQQKRSLLDSIDWANCHF